MSEPTYPRINHSTARSSSPPTETAEWVLRIDITESGTWDDVADRLREVADQLSDLPLSETYWDRKGGLLAISTVEVFVDGVLSDE